MFSQPGGLWANSSQNQSFERDRSRHPSSLRYSPTPDFLSLSLIAPYRSVPPVSPVTTFRFLPRLAVHEHHVLFDGLAADVQLIGREVGVGVSDRQTAQNRKFRRDSQLRADDFGIPCD